MKNIIIGTAGHVDHGKTTLIKALTGIDADRLQEEKKRGITIDLGFAFLDTPNGEKAGIIDVPGHEKFIKNMLAGAGGVDFALLVVAADDGVMPQTRGELRIFSLLGITDGLIVITKTDLADPDWLGLISEDITKTVAGTFLENAPVIPVSAYTGAGLEHLKELIFQKIEQISAKNATGGFRVPVDRVFSIDGFGTVITGTIIEGTLKEGQEAQLYPGGTLTRIRNLQAHSRDVETARAGQRIAINLAGLSKEDVKRGDVLALPGSMRNTMMLDVSLRILPDCGRVVKNGSRLHFYHGARDMLCKLTLLENDTLEPGQEGYAQLRFTEELAAKKGDRFVLRFYSPIETIGGGVILNSNPPKHRRGNAGVLDALKITEHGSVSENLLQAVATGSPKFTPLAEIQRQLLLDAPAFKEELDKLAEAGSVILLGDRHAIDAGYKSTLLDSITKILRGYHAANPLQAGMRRDELRSRLLPGRDPALADKVLSIFAEEMAITLDGQKAALAGFKVSQSEKSGEIEALFRDAGYAPPSAEEVYAAYPKEKGRVKQILEAMLAGGELVAVAPQLYFHKDAVTGAQEKISAFIAQNGQITLAGFRDLSGTSRKFALALLEYFDRHGVTKKVGDARVMAKKQG